MFTYTHSNAPLQQVKISLNLTAVTLPHVTTAAIVQDGSKAPSYVAWIFRTCTNSSRTWPLSPPYLRSPHVLPAHLSTTRVQPLRPSSDPDPCDPTRPDATQCVACTACPMTSRSLASRAKVSACLPASEGSESRRKQTEQRMQVLLTQAFVSLMHS